MRPVELSGIQLLKVSFFRLEIRTFSGMMHGVFEIESAAFVLPKHNP
ncbi:hypothetical protein C8K11_10235 [Novosphingobium sp. GV055]|nr:hypothetical protein C8K11_10235 [Novosphingobium sp. GV055]PUB06366.1 hypothetical protein C8K12_10235 [Novosphingobium sp. GV061]PUB22417.1 hypothetical protein C8K14_10235 [Novosphingobium sp. GV079]PUB44442.1 hypothetical protein C8K10_10235 [Novosphingobium sp. GV027]